MIVPLVAAMKVKKGMICELKSVICSCSSGGKTHSFGTGCCLRQSGGLSNDPRVAEVSRMDTMASKVDGEGLLKYQAI